MEDEELTLDPETVEGEEQAESAKCFSTVKKGRFVPILELRFYDGNALGVRYSIMHPLIFNKSTGITIDAPPVRVCLKGRNLKTLWLRLLTESVVWIKELPLKFDRLEASETVVNQIELVNVPSGMEEKEVIE